LVSYLCHGCHDKRKASALFGVGGRFAMTSSAPHSSHQILETSMVPKWYPQPCNTFAQRPTPQPTTPTQTPNPVANLARVQVTKPHPKPAPDLTVPQNQIIRTHVIRRAYFFRVRDCLVLNVEPLFSAKILLSAKSCFSQQPSRTLYKKSHLHPKKQVRTPQGPEL
jgi:hypothetical protein